MAINDEQAEKLRITMSTAGWNEVIIPTLKQKSQGALNALRLDQSERKSEGGPWANTDDATLRAVIRETEWLTYAFSNEVKVYDANKRRDELEPQ